jgi:hypothetical protein
VKLAYISLEGCVIPFCDLAKDSELIAEMQLLLRNAGCQVTELDGIWSANFAATIATFCAIHELTAHGITPDLATELLEYGD